MSQTLSAVLLGAQTAARKKPCVSIDVRDKMWSFTNFADYTSQSANIVAYDAHIGQSAILGFINSTGGVQVKVIGAAAATASATWNPSAFTVIATGAWLSANADISVGMTNTGQTAYVNWLQRIGATGAYWTSFSTSFDGGATWAAKATGVVHPANTDYNCWNAFIEKNSNSTDPYVNINRVNDTSVYTITLQNSAASAYASRTIPDKYFLASAFNSGHSKPVAFGKVEGVLSTLEEVSVFVNAAKNSANINGATIYQFSYDNNSLDWYPIRKIISVDTPSAGSYLNGQSYITGLRGSRFGGNYYLTYAQTDLNGTSYRYIKSPDLEHWTAPYVFSTAIWGVGVSAQVAQEPFKGGYLLGLGSNVYTWDGQSMAYTTDYSASDTTKNLSLGSDIVNYTIAKGHAGAKIVIDVANSGKYVGPSPSAAGYQALKRDSEILVQEGWFTSATATSVVSEGLYYIDSVEQITSPARDNIRITARDKFKHVNNYVAETLVPYDNQILISGKLNDPKVWNITSSQTYNAASAMMPLVQGDSFWAHSQLRDGVFGVKLTKANTTSQVTMYFQYADLSSHYILRWQSDNNVVIYQNVNNSASARHNQSHADTTTIHNFEVRKDELAVDLIIDATNANTAGSGTFSNDHEMGAFGIVCDSGSANVYDLYAYENYPQRSVGWMLDDIAYKGEFSYSTSNIQTTFSDPLTATATFTAYNTANGTWDLFYDVEFNNYQFVATRTVANSPFFSLTTSQPMLSANQSEPSNGRIDANFHAAFNSAKSEAGLIACASDSANFLLASISRNSAFIKKCVGGTYTNLAYAPYSFRSSTSVLNQNWVYTPASFIVNRDWATLEIDGNSVLSTKLSSVSMTGQYIGMWATLDTGEVARLSGALAMPTLFNPVSQIAMFPGQDGLTFMDQVASIQNANVFSRHDGTFAAKTTSATGAVARTYYNEVQGGGEFWNDQKYNHVVVVGKADASGIPIKAHAYNYSKIAAAGNALRTKFVVDESLSSYSACQGRADDMLDSFGNTYQYVPLSIWRDVGVELFDTVSVIDTRTSYQTGTFNVYGIQKRYDPKEMQYDMLLNLGNFEDKETTNITTTQAIPQTNNPYRKNITPLQTDWGNTQLPPVSIPKMPDQNTNPDNAAWYQGPRQSGQFYAL